MHKHLAAIAIQRHESKHAFEAISEIGRYPRSEPVNPQRVNEAAQKARHDAALLNHLADQLEALK